MIQRMMRYAHYRPQLTQNDWAEEVRTLVHVGDISAAISQSSRTLVQSNQLDRVSCSYYAVTTDKGLVNEDDRVANYKVVSVARGRAYDLLGLERDESPR